MHRPMIGRCVDMALMLVCYLFRVFLSSLRLPRKTNERNRRSCAENQYRDDNITLIKEHVARVKREPRNPRAKKRGAAFCASRAKGSSRIPIATATSFTIYFVVID